MRVTVIVCTVDYTGLLSFLSEELVPRRKNGELLGFYIFRYHEQNDSIEEQEHVALEIRGASNALELYFMNRLQDLKKVGLIKDIDFYSWRLPNWVFGSKGKELATNIFEVATELAIDVREKFGRLIDPQNEFPDEVMQRYIAPGVWLLISQFFNASGYSPLEEINAYITAIQNRLKFMNAEDSEQIRRLLHLSLDMV